MLASRTADTLPAKLLLCFALVAGADWLFYDERLGWTAGLYGGALVGILCLMHRNLLRQMGGRVVAVMLCVLVAALVEDPGALQVSLFLAGIAALLVLPKRQEMTDAMLCLKDMLRLAIRIPVQWRRDQHASRKAGKKKTLVRPLLMPALYRLMPPLLLAGVFCALFTSANPLIEKLLSQYGWKIDWEALFSPSRWFFWWIAAIGVWALLRPRSRLSKATVSERMNLDRWIDKNSLVGSLLLFNLIFAVQNGMDIAFLWGGGVLPQGMTMADYAHAGAYPLIVTALLAGAYVLVTFDDQRRHYRTAAARWLVTAWVAQNIFLVASSIDRTLLYIDTYSLTYLRVAALIWMGLVALGLAFIVLRIFLSRSNTWLVNANALALVAVLYSCCFINFDRLIADYNVHHAREITGEGAWLDFEYMENLGTEAIPAFAWFAAHTPEPKVALKALGAASRLEEKLQGGSWKSWTWRKQRMRDHYITGETK